MNAVQGWLRVGYVVLCLGGMASAAELRTPEEEALSSGPLSVRVGGIYSDNRDGTSTNKHGNLDAIVEPRADFRYQDADRTSLRLSLMPLLKWHSNPRTALDGGEQHAADLFGSAELDAMHRLTPNLTLKAGDRLAYNDDPRIMESGTTLRRNESYLYNDAQVGLESVFTALTGLGLMGEGATTRYQDSGVAKDLDSTFYRGELTPYFIAGDGWKVIGLAGASEFQEETTDRNRGSATELFQAGVERTFAPGLVGKVLGGYQFIQYDNPLLDPEDTISGAAELVLLSTLPTRLRLNARYGFMPPSVSEYSAQKATTLSGTVDHEVLANTLTLHFQGEYRDGQYTREGAEAPGGSERMTSLGLYGTYFVNRQWSLTGGYALENWDSQVRESFTRNLVEVSVKAVW